MSDSSLSEISESFFLSTLNLCVSCFEKKGGEFATLSKVARVNSINTGTDVVGGDVSGEVWC